MSAALRHLKTGPKGKRQRYEELAAALIQERSTFDSHWREISDWLLPRRTRFWKGDRNKGDKRNQNILTSTARFAHRTLQSGLHAGLTSPARPWFQLSTGDPDLATYKPVKEWLDTVTKRMRAVFNTTNLYNALPTVYGDISAFGTGAVGILPDTDDLFRAYTYPIGSYALSVDGRGLPGTFVREYEMTVEQVIGQFGVEPGMRDIDRSKFSKTVLDAWDKGEYLTPVAVTWIVTHNEDYRERNPFAKYRKFASCHFETDAAKDDKRFLRESGYSTFPLMLPRWEVTAPEDPYGEDCPGMSALGDIKQLMSMTKDKARAVKKGIDPPMKGEAALRGSATSLLPGAMNYVRDPQHGFSPAHEVNTNLGDLRIDIQAIEYQIKVCFYENLFAMMSSSDQLLGADRPTAREIAERHEEKLILLGPTLDRQNDELLDPLIDRVFAMMLEQQWLPEAPEEIRGVKLKVEYISILAQAQKLLGLTQLDRFLSSMLPLAEFAAMPGPIANKIDFNRVVDVYGEHTGVDPRIIRSDEDADAMTAQQQKAQAEAQQAATMKDQAAAMAAAGAKPIAPDSALERVLSGMGAAQ